MEKVELFDTHCHFDPDNGKISALLERCASSGVTRIMAVGGSAVLNDGALMAKSLNVQGIKVFTALGWDRDQKSDALQNATIDYSKADAVGEIGLDYYYDRDTRNEQLKLFSEQLEIARELGKIVIIHTREADDDTLGVLREIPSRGIIHCFTGNPGFCRKLLDLGFFISISGIVTFRAADNVRESCLIVPDDRLLIETDSPFLAPVPMRGNENEPSFIVHTARFVADLRKIAYEKFADLTTANALRILGE
jgi:TatD DNase family protein